MGSRENKHNTKTMIVRPEYANTPPIQFYIHNGFIYVNAWLNDNKKSLRGWRDYLQSHMILDVQFTQMTGKVFEGSWEHLFNVFHNSIYKGEYWVNREFIPFLIYFGRPECLCEIGAVITEYDMHYNPYNKCCMCKTGVLKYFEAETLCRHLYHEACLTDSKCPKCLK